MARWPKGFVHPPTDAQKHHYFLEDHQANLIGLLGLDVLLMYYAGRGSWWAAVLPGASVVPLTRPTTGIFPRRSCATFGEWHLTRRRWS